MSFSFGNRYRINLFGTSHGECVGITIDGLPAGTEIDFAHINTEIQRRKSTAALSTARREKDSYRILSGIFKGKTDGGPITCIFPNKDTESRDYDRNIFRPGHADYTAFAKYGGNNDWRGGGFFSGRMTAPIVFAGAIGKQILAQKNIEIYSHIQSVKQEKEINFEAFAKDENFKNTLKELSKKSFPCIEKETEFLDIIKNAENDSVGGVCEIMVLGMPVGVGEPFFHSIESTLSSVYFSVPGIKGVEFGDGFAITELLGSRANDCPKYKDGKITFESNHSGGINGGISSGMPIIARVAVRPTPTIRKEQNSINIQTEENIKFCGKGRHDKAIILRIAPVMEAATAIGLIDLIL